MKKSFNLTPKENLPFVDIPQYVILNKKSLGDRCVLFVLASKLKVCTLSLLNRDLVATILQIAVQPTPYPNAALEALKLVPDLQGMLFFSVYYLVFIVCEILMD
jgi:hypothetical protein